MANREREWSRADRATMTRLRERMKELRGYESQNEIADRAEMDRSHLADLEAGRGNPTLHILIRIARALDVDMAELFRP